jgi:hypothetical protein
MAASIDDIRNDRQFKALTGMARTEFEQFLPTFGGLKRVGILVQRFRNHIKDFVDEAGIIGAGLWNWKLKCKGIAY